MHIFNASMDNLCETTNMYSRQISSYDWTEEKTTQGIRHLAKKVKLTTLP
uniref:Uncharacterized protein n=1 Tax=Rhizophora mucronata TaxID=61149 RepID=A0A2P2ISB0_RHIMU